MNKFNPDALAECGDIELDQRDGVQAVTADMIQAHVTERNALPPHGAAAFATWLAADAWGDFNEDGDKTNGQVLDGALADWCGGK